MAGDVMQKNRYPSDAVYNLLSVIFPDSCWLCSIGSTLLYENRYKLLIIFILRCARPGHGGWSDEPLFLYLSSVRSSLRMAFPVGCFGISATRRMVRGTL